MFLDIYRKYKLFIALIIGLIIIFIALFVDVFAETDYEQLHFDTYRDGTDKFDLDIYEDDNILVFSSIIDEELLGKSLAFYTSDCFVDVFVNENKIYHYGFSARLCKSPGSRWQFVELSPSSCKLGDEVKVYIINEYDNKFNVNQKILVGSSAAILMDLLSSGYLDLFINLVIIFVSFALLFLSVYAYLERDEVSGVNFFLGLLALCIVLWSSTEIFVVQILLPTGIGQYVIYYVFFQLLPILLCLYINRLCEKPVRLSLNLFVLLCLGLGICHMFGIAEYTESIIVFLAGCMFLFIVMIVHFIKFKKKDLPKSLIVGFIVFIIFCCINILQYFLAPVEHTSLAVAKMGFVLYLLVAFWDFVKNELHSIEIRHEKEEYAKAALVDVLTGLKSRFAFNLDIQKISVENICLISFDVNNLKYYNDTFGHTAGDTLLNMTSEILEKTYGKVNVYRTGGDEFMCILSKYTTVYEFEKYKKTMYEIGIQVEQEHDNKIIVEIASGFSKYQDGDNTYEDIMKRSDAEMYKNKIDLKKNTRLNLENYKDSRL